ncbi:MAG: TolC family protein [Bacteroidota bacterium]|nr:TolC family protein [Bacteroidota bacterium]
MPVALVWAAIFNANAQQDTVTITLSQAEQQFTSKNLQLLAEKYNIDIARAGEIQARLYNNPNFQVSSALYNQEQKKWLDVSNNTGQYSFGIQQLITLAGKRNKQIQLAQTNTRQAENSFFDLLRTLRYTLRSGFYNIYFLQHSVKAYAAQIATLERLDAAYSDLQTKGVVTLKDLVRIRSLLYSLKAEQTGLQNQLNDAEADLRLLMQNNKSWYVAQADSSLLNTNIDRLNLQQLTDSAIANRYDLKQAATALQYNQQNYSLQKALRVPDLSLGAEFDKRGSYINNASFLNAAIDLPFFNRNQGNIKAAKLGIEQSKLQLELQQSIVENDVQKAYAHLLTTQQMLKNIDPAFRNQFQQLMDGVTENFLKRNISLLDFTDFVESYKNNVLQLNQLQNDRMQAIEALNFSVGKTIVD